MADQTPAQRLTALERGLQEAIDTFTPIARRVEELSAAYLAANRRLVKLETQMQVLTEEDEGTSDDQLQAINNSIDALSARVSSVEQARSRGGRLSQRLAEMQAKIDELSPDPEEVPPE